MTAEETPAPDGENSRRQLLELLEALLRERLASSKGGRKGPKCGSKRKKGRGKCTQPAGWGTTHPGEGKCKLHGGLRPGDKRLKHGLYSTVTTTPIRELFREHQANPDPLNILPELALSRALLEHVLQTTKDGEPDIGAATRLVETVTKISERVIKAENINALSIPDVYRLMDELGKVVERHVEDESVRDLIRRDWLAIRF